MTWVIDSCQCGHARADHDDIEMCCDGFTVRAGISRRCRCTGFQPPGCVTLRVKDELL